METFTFGSVRGSQVKSQLAYSTERGGWSDYPQGSEAFNVRCYSERVCS
jgi:hypothetical protein